MVKSSQFDEGYRKYSGEVAEKEIIEPEKTIEELRKEYYREEVKPRIREQFRDYIEAIFSEEGYFLDFRTSERCEIVIYGEYNLGITIHIAGNSYPNYENRHKLDNYDLLAHAKFDISRAHKIFGFNRKSDDPDKIANKMNILYADMVNDHSCRCFGSGLDARDGKNGVKIIHHEDVTLEISSKQTLDFFLGGVSAISNPMLQNSERHLKKMIRRDQIAFAKWIGIIITISYIAYHWVF